MTLQASGQISMSEINTELGRASNATISLDTAENGGYAVINTNSASRPSSTNPASMSEWYGYNHNAGGTFTVTVYASLQSSATNETSWGIYYSINNGSQVTLVSGLANNLTTCVTRGTITGISSGDSVQIWTLKSDGVTGMQYKATNAASSCGTGADYDIQSTSPFEIASVTSNTNASLQVVVSGGSFVNL